MSLAIQQNLSVFIPRVLSTMNDLEIGHFFEYYDFGKVMNVDLVRYNRRFNKAVVYFEYWNQNEMVENFQEKMMKGSGARVMYDEPNYWNLYLNRRDGSGSGCPLRFGKSLSLNLKTNENGAKILAAIGRVKTNQNGAKILDAISGKSNLSSGIRYIYRELEDGEVIE
jgi:hypothetical protein